jgi:membrane-associated phospholipid phosphatase
MQIYAQSRLRPVVKGHAIVPLFQVLVLACSMWICYSRMRDHMHHWSDVLAGMLFGSGVAAFVVSFLA